MSLMSGFSYDIVLETNSFILFVKSGFKILFIEKYAKM